MPKVQAVRYHDFSYGHRVYGHESSCSHLHGHNGRITFHVVAENLDDIGRVMDFSVIKSRLCQWLEDNWDHKFLVNEHDPWAEKLKEIDPEGTVLVPFNPTAENMGIYLLHEIGPHALKGTNVRLIKVIVEETRKCSAEIEI